MTLSKIKFKNLEIDLHSEINIFICENIDLLKGVLSEIEKETPNAFIRHLPDSETPVSKQQGLFRQIAKDSEQSFFSTFCPMSILDFECSQIHLIHESESGKLEIYRNGGTKYAGVSMTVLKYFHHTTVSETLKKGLDKYYDLLENEPDNPELETLKAKLRDVYPGITLFNETYVKFLQILRRKGLNSEDFENRPTFSFSDAEWDELEKELFEENE